MSSPDTPADTGLGLWRNLVAGDETASAEFAALYLAPLCEWLCRTNPGTHPDDCATAAGDALIGLFRNPSCYDPGRRPDPFRFLQMAAAGDLRNLLARERRHHRGRRDLRAVELDPDAGKYLGRDDDPSFPLRLAEAEARAVPPKVYEGLTDSERRAVELVLAKERSTETFAEVMGIAHLPGPERAAAVKRFKDKINQRLERSGGGADEPP